MFENPRRGRQARNLTTNAPKILVLKSSSEQIFSRKLPLGAPVQWKPARERATDCYIFQSTALFEFAMHYTKKTTINKQILCRFQKNFFQGSENWNSPSFFRCFAPCPAFLWAEKLSCSVVLPPKNAQTFIGRHFFLHIPDFSLSKVTALKVLWGKDTSRRSKEPGSDLSPCFSAWAPFCKCGWRHHIFRSGCGPDWSLVVTA